MSDTLSVLLLLLLRTVVLLTYDIMVLIVY
jgi:hypothetical protein